MIFGLLFLSLFSGLSCKKGGGEAPFFSHGHGEEGHHHTHYREQDTILSHKIIYPSKVPDRIIANLPQDPATTLSVNWRTNQQIDTAYIEIALATDGPEFLLGEITRVRARTEQFWNHHTLSVVEPMVKANYHSATVTGLLPNTTYVYRVGRDGGNGNELWSEWFQYTTAADEKDKEFSFIYFGDAQNDVKSMWSRVVRNSYRKFPKVGFMLHAGDLINSKDSNLEWGEWFYAGSFIHATVPSMMTPGNHEYKSGKILTPLWRPQFNLPMNGPKGVDAVLETSYFVDYQDLRVISLDCMSFVNNEASRNAHIKWLDSILSDNDRKWTAITMHYPVYTPAKKRNDNDVLIQHLKPLIDKYQVDLVLQGHDHTYARGEISNTGTGATSVSDAGTIYAVSVSGPKMYESMDKDWIERRGEFTQLFQIITIKGDSLSYEAYTPIGTMYDAFDLIKDKSGKKLVNRIPDSPVRLKKDFVE
ncbi:MAG: metallophosphoesterase [Muricauda sp.]|nr:metallophosphoesterase [Allomuricauda sp.]|tara:strand:- start:6127 stop:7551 length:1425 start_codon:yes stop_codon:yes gene_type:complete